jgi:branched-chain amino acid transport system substrate-binding protein
VTTNTTATIVAGQTTTTTTKPTTTTVSSGPEVGRPIRLGLVSAKTGPLALFGKADDWWTDFGHAAIRDGLLCGDRKLHQVTFVSRDCRSRADLAATAASDLISNGRVDMIMSSGGSGIVNAVASQAETLGCPCLSDFVQWRPFILDRGGAPDKPFKWTYAHAIGLEDLVANFVAMWEQLQTNRKIGLVFADNADGRLWADAATGLPPAATAAGYECVLSGLYPMPTEDFTTYIKEFQKNGCEICCGSMPTADFITFGKQAVEQDYKPKIVSVAGALLFPQAAEAVGASARNTAAESLWQPNWPYADSITGKTDQDLADDYMNKTGEQWTCAIAQYAKFEWAVDVFKRAWSLTDGEDIIAQVRNTKLQTCRGLIDFTAPIDMTDVNRSKRPAENVYKAPVGGAQWVTGSTFAFEPRLLANENSSDLRAAGTIEPMEY